MSLLTLTSLAGAPGVTTSAVGLTLAWPRDIVLVDADRSGVNAIAAGYLCGQTIGGRGLTALAQTYRDGRDIASDLTSHLLPLGDDQNGPRRWFLPGFSRPGSAQLFEPVWPSLATALSNLDKQGIDVIVDAGRYGSQGLPGGLLSQTRSLALITRSQLRSLVALQVYLPDIKTATSSITSCSLGLIIVGPGNPYSAGEISSQFSLPIWGELPFQPDDAAAYSDGASPKGRISNRPLARALLNISNNCRTMAEQWESQVARPRYRQEGNQS